MSIKTLLKPNVTYIPIKHPDIKQFIKNKASANYSHDMRDRLDIKYEDYDGVDKVYAIKCPYECDRNLESLKEVLGSIVNIHRYDYTITELVTDVSDKFPIRKGELIEFKARRFMRV